MPSPVRRATAHSWIAPALSITTSVLTSVATSAPAGAQQPSAQTSVAIAVRVQPPAELRLGTPDKLPQGT